MASYTRQSSFADGDTITSALFNNEFNQLVNALHNSTGHKHDGTTAEGPVIGLIGDAGETAPNNKVLIDTTNNFVEFYVQVSSAPVQQLYIADGAIIPVTDSDIDLGTSALRFKNAYIDSITTTGNIDVGGNLTVTGTTTFNGGTLTMGDAATDNVVFGADINSSIIPNTDDTYDLGSSTQEWRNIYIDGTANVDVINLAGTVVTSTAAELNILDGVTSTAAELNILDGVTSTFAELNILDGVTSTAAELNILDGVTSTAVEINLLDGVTATTAELNILDGVTSTFTELNLLDGVTSTTAELNILDGVTSTAAEINTLDGVTAVVGELNALDIGLVAIGTAVASKAVILDANKDYTGVRNLTISGELDAATLDISGDADIDGTLEADAITIGGITLSETIADTVGAMVTSNTESGITVAYVDLDNTLDFTVGTLNQDTTGLAGTATALATARTIGGTSFDGTANIAVGLADTATILATTRAIAVAGDVTGTANFDGSAAISITTTLATDAIVTANITNANVTVAKMAANSVDSDQYVDGSIDTIHIADDQITLAKMAGLTRGNVIIGDASGNPTALTIGTSGYVLKSDGTDIAWAADATATALTTEEVQDIAGAMFSSNTESGITATYQDADGTVDLTVGTLNQNTTGSAATLTTARTIGGTSFDGSANIAVGLAATATILATARTLGGVSFDGSANINLPGVNSAGNQATSGLAATATLAADATTLATARTIGGVSFDGSANITPTTFATASFSGAVTAATSAKITQVAITSSSAAVAWDSTAAANAYHLTTENTTFSAPSNAVEGAIITLELAQGGTARTIAWNTVFEFAASTAPTVTATASKTDIFTFRYNGSVWQEIGRSQNMAQT